MTGISFTTALPRLCLWIGRPFMVFCSDIPESGTHVAGQDSLWLQKKSLLRRENEEEGNRWEQPLTLYW